VQQDSALPNKILSKKAPATISSPTEQTAAAAKNERDMEEMEKEYLEMSQEEPAVVIMDKSNGDGHVQMEEGAHDMALVHN
jgi:hypothetical protein